MDVKMCEINKQDDDQERTRTHSSPSCSRPQSGVRKSDTISDWPLPLAFGFDLLVVWVHPVLHSSFWKKVDSSWVTRMRWKRPWASGTGNPFGCGNSSPSWPHRWNRHSYPIHHSTKPSLYSTTSGLLCPS